jgi:hypothetical protein
MIEFKKPHIECIETPSDRSYGKFVVEPLERGYGTTLGNSLRRVLLSSLPGTACTNVRIDGVQHEFSTIPGIKEDVTEIILNVKSIIANLGTSVFPRLRIGVGEKPFGWDLADHVLARFPKEEEPLIREAFKKVTEEVPLYLTEGAEAAMNRFN